MTIDRADEARRRWPPLDGAFTPPPFDPEHDALFLDLDGTLVDIRDRPEHVVIDDALRAALVQLVAQTAGAVALITGRTARDADRILGGVLSCIAGVHGLDRRSGAASSAPETSPGVEAARAALLKARHSAYVEDKGVSLALHYRHAPEAESEVRALARHLAARHDLRVLHGKMVAELLPHGVTKGDALADLMRERPFCGRRPIAVGDDVTDEDAFAAARLHGGYGVRVGPPSAHTAARYRLADASAVRAWLEASAEARA